MTSKTKDQIKAFFQTGDRPTESQFIDFIDSYVDMSGPIGTIQAAASAGTQGFAFVSGFHGEVLSGANALTFMGATVVTTAQSIAAVAGTYTTTAQAAAVGGANYRGAVVYSSVDLGVSANSVTYPFDTESLDTDNIHSTSVNPSRLTVPAGVTRVKLSGQFSVSDNQAGTFRYASFLKNGGTLGNPSSRVQSTMPPNGSGTVTLNVYSPITSVAAGDYFEFLMQASVSGTSTVTAAAGNTWFEMQIIQ